MIMRRRIIFFLLSCVAVFAALAVIDSRADDAGRDGGESVVLVYNSRSAGSKSVADHYARMRHVPATNIISLDLPEFETISRDEFEKRLQQPLWNELRARKLFICRDAPPDPAGPLKCNVIESKVRYAVLCYGVPLKIDPDPNLKEEVAEKLPAALRRNEAAVDSELALLPYFDQKLPLVGFLSNPLHFATNRNLMTPTNGVLMVARVDGPTADIAKGLVDKAMEAEREGLWGRAYFDLRGITNDPYN